MDTQTASPTMRNADAEILDLAAHRTETSRRVAVRSGHAYAPAAFVDGVPVAPVPAKVINLAAWELDRFLGEIDTSTAHALLTGPSRAAAPVGPAQVIDFDTYLYTGEIVLWSDSDLVDAATRTALVALEAPADDYPLDDDF